MPPDELNPANVETPVVAPVATPEPVVAAPAAPETPVVASPESAPAETLASEAAPVEKAAEPAPAAEPAVETTSLLEQIGKKPEAAKPDAEKPAETPVEAAAPVATEWDIKLPDVIKADDATLGRFKETLESLMKPKEGETASHAANRLLDMHAEAMAAYDKSMRAEQVNVWNATRKGWITQIMADPDIGGAAYKTNAATVARVRDKLVSNHNPDASPKSRAAYEKDVKDLNDFMWTTGAGDHPVFWKLMKRAAPYVDEPQMITAKASPPPNAGKKPGHNLYSE